MSDLTPFLTLTSIDLTWSAPEEPNGVIISYEVTYRVTESNLVTTNTTELSTTFSISSLTPQTTVSNISVSAYTSIGPGEAATIADQTTLCELLNKSQNNYYCVVVFVVAIFDAATLLCCLNGKVIDGKY